jgi:hypothetical protein
MDTISLEFFLFKGQTLYAFSTHWRTGAPNGGGTGHLNQNQFILAILVLKKRFAVLPP